MKKYLIVALVALSVITAFGFLIHQNKKLRRERDAYHNNTEVLLSEVERYQTKAASRPLESANCSCGWRSWSGTAPTMPR